MGRKKPGPKGRLKNPRPFETYDSTGDQVILDEWISGADLDKDEKALRAFFKLRRKQLVRRAGEDLGKAVGRIRRLAEEALEHCDAGRWTDCRIGHFEPGRRLAVWPFPRYYSRRAVAPVPPKRPADGCLWIDTSQVDRPLKRWDLASKSWQVIFQETAHLKGPPAQWFNSLQTGAGSYHEWVHLKIGPAIRRMLSGNMGRLAKAGKPAFLAAAVLADLSNQEIERVADFLHHRRRILRRNLQSNLHGNRALNS